MFFQTFLVLFLSILIQTKYSRSKVRRGACCAPPGSATDFIMTRFIFDYAEKIHSGHPGGGGALPYWRWRGHAAGQGMIFTVIHIGTGYLNRPNWLLGQGVFLCAERFELGQVFDPQRHPPSKWKSSAPPPPPPRERPLYGIISPVCGSQTLSGKWISPSPFAYVTSRWFCSTDGAANLSSPAGVY